MAHGAELQMFIGDGETRQLYALDRRSGRIVYIEDGQAEPLRPDCRVGHLICPIEGCESRSFTTYGGTQKRHHFKHLHRGAAAHGPESYYHQLGKALLGQRLRDRHPEARVVVDQEALDNGQRPDVLVQFPDARRFGFELQYSPLTAEEFERRHRGYAQQGVVDVWLLGHLPPHLRPSRDSSFMVDLGPLAQAIHAAGQPIRFFSPDERKIAAVLCESGLFYRYSHVGELAYDDLELCEIRGETFWTPTDDIETAARIAREAEEEKERPQREAAAARAEAKHRAGAERKKREADWKVEHRRGRRQREQAWRVAEPKVRACFGLDELPAIISEARPSDWGVEWHPAHWHARFFWKHIEGKLGETFSYSDAIRDFYREQPYGRESAQRAVGGYLFQLRRSGYLLFYADGYWIDGDILVVADLKHPPSSAQAQQLLAADLAVDNGDVILAAPDYAILQRLRPRRDEDAELPILFQIVEQERQRQRDIQERAAADDPLVQMGGTDFKLNVCEGRVEILLYDDLWQSPFQSEVREIVAANPGDARVAVTVFPRERGPIREIALAGRVEPVAFAAAAEGSAHAGMALTASLSQSWL
jgi:hypothetical protein